MFKIICKQMYIMSLRPHIGHCRRLSNSSVWNGVLRDNSQLADKKHTSDMVIVEKHDNVTLIGINRPNLRNAINLETAQCLSHAIMNFEKDKQSPVAVLYGVGGSFSVGYDVRELVCDDTDISKCVDISNEMAFTGRHTSKPIICSVSGYCTGSGLELALVCDLRVMEESAVLGFINRRFSVPIVNGGTMRLPAMIGLSRALDLILTGRQLTAKEAFEFGIANRIVATGTSFGQAISLARSISNFPPATLCHDRNAVYTAVYNTTSFDMARHNELNYKSKQILDEMQQVTTSIKQSDSKRQILADWQSTI